MLEFVKTTQFLKFLNAHGMAARKLTLRRNRVPS